MHIAVIGGGWGGLAAAVELAANRIPVVLYEAAREPGGRARRIQYNGVDLDNGQHILLGAYGETLRLMKLCGVAADSLLRLPLKWYFHPGFLIQNEGLAGKLPAPLDLLGAFLKARGMSLQQKLSVVKFVTAMRLRQFRLHDDTTVDRLLDMYGQHNALRECLWEPLCVSALNTPIRTASAQIFLNVLRDGLFGGKGCSDLLIPQKNLGDIFPQPAVRYVLQNGGEVRTGVAVTAIRTGDSAFAVSTRDDQQVFSHVICATGPHQVAFLLECLPALQPVVRRIEALEYEPIVTVYIQYNQSVMIDNAMTGLSGGVVQWIFDREKLSGHKGLLAAVVSASGVHREWQAEDLALKVINEIAQAFPHVGTPLWHKVITEKRATFSCRPGVERPRNATAVRNFYLAGDYTDGDYPATLEAAVRSGVNCARLCIDSAKSDHEN